MEHVWALKWINYHHPEENWMNVYKTKEGAAEAMRKEDKEFMTEPRDVTVDRREYHNNYKLAPFGISYEEGPNSDGKQVFCELTVEAYELLN